MCSHDPWNRGATAVDREGMDLCVEGCERVAALLLEDAPTLMDVLLKCDAPAAATPTVNVAAHEQAAFPCRCDLY